MLLRWVNMDYIFVNAMLRHLVVRKLVTYDIACQWSKGILGRIAKFPSHLHIPLPTDSIKYAIPKLHWSAHERKNHSQFSLNFIPGAARSDGEGVERRFWWIQPVANSTKLMGPGGRQGVLEDQWGYGNWRKIVDFGASHLICCLYIVVLTRTCSGIDVSPVYAGSRTRCHPQAGVRQSHQVVLQVDHQAVDDAGHRMGGGHDQA